MYGSAQAGMLCELARHGFRPDVIVGVSAGALNGAFMAQEWSHQRAEELARIWTSVDRREVFPSGMLSQLVKLIARKDALQSAKGLEALVERFAPVHLDECEVPVHVGATDLLTGELTWWSRGQSLPRLCASAALPGVIPPVVVDQRGYIDGGVVANLPVERAVSLGASRIVCLDVSVVDREHVTPDSALAVLLKAYAHTRQALQHAQLARWSHHADLHHITVPLPHLAPDDFSHASELVELGREAARMALPGLLAKEPIPKRRVWALSQRFRRPNTAPTMAPTTPAAPAIAAMRLLDSPVLNDTASSSSSSASSASVSPMGVVLRTAQSMPNGHSDLNPQASPEA